jgi:prephenate dehydratase
MMLPVMSVKGQVTQALDTLSESELQQVAEYVTFLRFRARVAPQPVVDAAQLATLYAEFADEDRALAEEGLEGYRAHLHDEDTQ